MTKGEPLNWKPKLLAFAEAREFHDYETIEVDLLFSKSCFERLSTREYGVIFTGTLQSDAHSVDWCIFVAGALCYRRCFTTGMRCRLSRSDMAGATPDFLALHDTMMAIVDKHLAHSVNDMELGCANLNVAIDSQGKLHRGGLGRSGSGTGPLHPMAYKKMSDLIDWIVGAVLKKKIADLQVAVRGIVDQMTDEQIRALPDGFSPHINQPKYDRPRRWPKLPD